MLQEKMINIYLIGDSTCQTNNDETYPQIGWGQVFNKYIKDKYSVINLAKNGRSSKSFLEEGLFKFCEENLNSGDYLFIQFGHNDEKDDERHTDPNSSYKKYLSHYIDFARNRNAIPVLLSSIYRRQFINKKLNPDCHKEYRQAMEELSYEKNVHFIDLTRLTKEILELIGDEESKKFYMNFQSSIYKNYPQGKEDNTHLRYLGAKLVCSLIRNELNKMKDLKELVNNN